MLVFQKKMILKNYEIELDQEIKKMKIDGTLTKIYSDYNMAYISEQLAEHETSYPPRQLYFPEVGGKSLVLVP